LTTIIGTGGNDTISNTVTGGVTTSGGTGSTTGADFILGLGGDDAINGRGGFDTIDGGDGNDVIGTAGAALAGQISGGAGNDTIKAADVFAGVVLDGGTGTDVLEITSGLSLNLLQTTLIGFETLDLVSGASLTMTAAQLDAFVTLRYGVVLPGLWAQLNLVTAGSVTLDLRDFETVYVNGAPGGNTFVFTTSGAVLTRADISAGLGNDSVRGGAGGDYIDGEEGNDTLDGGGGNDALFGGAGNDRFIMRTKVGAMGGADSDVFVVGENIGGTGIAFDTYMDGGDKIDQVIVTGTVTIAPDVLIQNVETLAIGTAPLTLSAAQLDSFDRVIYNGVAPPGATAWIQLNAAGSVAVSLQSFAVITLNGTAGDDSVLLDAVAGTPTSAVVNAGGGNDSVRSGIGRDVLSGEAGNDTLDGGGGGDTMGGGAGADRMVIREGTVADGEADDDLFVFDTDLVNATMIGGAGIDTLNPTGARVIGTAVSISGIENLALDASLLSLSAAQLDGFDSIIADGAATAGAIALTTTGTALAVVTGLATLQVTGTGGADDLGFITPGPGTLTSIRVAAGAGNDFVTGGAGDDSLDGGTQNDTLWGNGGADTLLGGDGADRLVLAGGDSADGGADDDLLKIDGSLSAATTVIGGSGVDTLEMALGGDISLAVVSGVEKLALSAQTTTISAAGLGAFSRITAVGSATVGKLALSSAGTIAPTVEGLATLNVRGSTGHDVLQATTAGVLVLDGAEGNDSVTGAGGRDSLSGGDGNDTLAIGASDSASGGAGDDLLVLTTDAPGLTMGSVAGGSGIDTVRMVAGVSFNIHAGFSFNGVERLALGDPYVSLRSSMLASFGEIVADGAATVGRIDLESGNQAVTLVVSGLAELHVFGSSDAESLVLGTPVGAVPTRIIVDAGVGDDSIAGGSGHDSLSGSWGSDTLFGGAGGADTLLGGEDADLLHLETGDSADGGAGNDTLFGIGDLNGATQLNGGSGIDTFLAYATGAIDAAATVLNLETLALGGNPFGISAAHLAGFQGIVAAISNASAAITLIAGGDAGTTDVTGLATLSVTGSGDDDVLVLTSLATAMKVQAGLGNDSIRTGNGADSLLGEDGEDSLDGGLGNDSLNGGGGDDILWGRDGVDRITAAGGADTIIGGAGADRIKGGGGQDVFRYDLPTEGMDRIADFVSGSDRLEISAAGFGGGLVAGAAVAAGQLAVRASNGATAPAGVGQFVFNTASSTLLWDADGAGGAAGTKIAVLTGVLALTTADFQLVA
jgi:Ca2+-binding RTX toxin-like protein